MIKIKIQKYLSIALVAFVVLIQVAAADIASDLTNFSLIITGFTGYFTSMMTVFMQPPLVYFVVLGIFVTFVHLVAAFLIKRGR